MDIKKILKLVLSFALAAVFVYFAFRGIDWQSFLKDISQTRWSWVALFVLTSILALVFRMFRWQALLRQLSKESRPSLLRIWDANNVGNLVNVVIPGSGEFVRCGYLTSAGASYDRVLGTVVSERICDLVAIFALMAVALMCGSDSVVEFFDTQVLGQASGNLSALWLVLGLCVLVALAIWALRHFRDSSLLCGKIIARLKGFSAGMASIIRMPRKWLFLLYTLGIWTMYVMMSFSIIRAMPDLAHLGMADALFLCAIGNFASVIPVPGGIGAYHYLVALALSGIYGVSWELGLLNATLNHELHAILILILGAVSYVSITFQGRNNANKPIKS